MLKRLSPILLLVLMLSLTGCEFSSVYTPSAVSCCTAIALDPSENGITLTLETASGSGEKSEISCISESGATIEAILEQMMLSAPGKLLLNTAQVVILSPELDEKHLADFVDYAIKKHELNIQSIVLNSRGCTAAEILNSAENKESEAQPKGVYLYSLISDSQSAAIYKSSLLELMRCTKDKNSASLILCAAAYDNDKLSVNGAGAYSDGVFVSWLDPDEVKILNIVRQNTKNQKPVFEMLPSVEGIQNTAIELSSLKSSFDGNTESVTVNVSGNYKPFEGENADHEYSHLMTDLFENVFDRTSLLGLDIFGIKEYLYKYNNDDYSDEFPNVSFNISLTGKTA